MSKDLGDRLDSWKSIARYLGRDVRTVRRWEKKGVGMPIQRVPGSRSVFAYTDALDAWLEVGAHQRHGGEEQPSRSNRGPRAMLVLGAVSAIAAVALVVSAVGLPAREASSLGTSLDEVVGYDVRGRVVWTYRHPEGRIFRSAGQSTGVASPADGDGPLFFLASSTIAEADNPSDRAELVALNSRGEHLWSVVPSDSLHFGAATFGVPWISGALSVHDISGRTRVAWSVHHTKWWPSVLFLVDETGDVGGPFVNSGWITTTDLLRDRTGDKLLVGGVSNSQRAAIMAVLNAAHIEGTSPETPGSEFECSDCPAGSALQYLVFRPTDVGWASGVPYNQTTGIEIVGDEIVVTVREGPAGSDVAWVYRFSTDLELLEAAPSDSYWPAHRLLEMEGKLDHDQAACGSKQGGTIRSWSPGRGWVELTLAASGV